MLEGLDAFGTSDKFIKITNQKPACANTDPTTPWVFLDGNGVGWRCQYSTYTGIMHGVVYGRDVADSQH